MNGRCRIDRILFGCALACCAAVSPAVLAAGESKAETMSVRRLLDLIADADDPCRAQYEQAVEQREASGRTSDLARAAGRTCLAGAETLGTIVLGPPPGDRDLAAIMRDALAACAGAMRLRADRLARFEADPRDRKEAVLREELGQANESCREAFERLAQP